MLRVFIEKRIPGIAKREKLKLPPPPAFKKSDSMIISLGFVKTSINKF